jgi:prepilin peptidase CpaA
MGAWLSWLVLLAAVVAACILDLRRRRIPNALVLATLAAGVALQTFLPSGEGLFAATSPGGLGAASALLAVGFMLILVLLLWRSGFFGGGDAKLLAALSAFAGPAGVVPLLLATLCCGGLLAIASALPRLRLVSLFPGTAALSGLRLPYAFAIAAGALLLAAGTQAGIVAW